VKTALHILAAIRLTALAAIAAATASMTCSCDRAGQWHLNEGAVWNTTYRIVYKAPLNLEDSVMAVMARVEHSLSPFDRNSVISRINRGESEVTDSLVDMVFAISQDVNVLSHGRFDPTVSPLVNLWGFGYDRDSRRKAESDTAGFIVPQAMIDSALQLTGISGCRIANGVIHKKHPATSFNFSAVTKGLACDLIAEMLERNGAANMMVEIGGEIAVRGKNRKGRDWKIQIDAPEADAAAHIPLRVIHITNSGIATSGNYRNFHDTMRYGRIAHTIDPVKGIPMQTDVISATVIAPTAAVADALATACMASTADSAIAMINRHPAAECLIVRITADSMHTTATAGFPELRQGPK